MRLPSIHQQHVRDLAFAFVVEAFVVVRVAEDSVSVVPEGAGAASVEIQGIHEAETGGQEGHLGNGSALSPARETAVNDDHIYPIVPADADHSAWMAEAVKTAFAVIRLHNSVVDEDGAGSEGLTTAAYGSGIGVRISAFNDIDAAAAYPQQSVDTVEFLRLGAAYDFAGVLDQSGRIEGLDIEITAVQSGHGLVRAAGFARDAASVARTVEDVAAVRGGLVTHYGYALMTVEYLELRVAGLNVAAYAVPVPVGLREGGGVLVFVDNIVSGLRCGGQHCAHKG